LPCRVLQPPGPMFALHDVRAPTGRCCPRSRARSPSPRRPVPQAKIEGRARGPGAEAEVPPRYRRGSRLACASRRECLLIQVMTSGRRCASLADIYTLQDDTTSRSEACEIRTAPASLASHSKKAPIKCPSNRRIAGKSRSLSQCVSSGTRGPPEREICHGRIAPTNTLL